MHPNCLYIGLRFIEDGLIYLSAMFPKLPSVEKIFGNKTIIFVSVPDNGLAML